MNEEIMLKVSNLTVYYGQICAVKEVSFSLRKGEILGIVGESGAGKSTVGRAIVNLLPEPGRITGGSILFENLDLRQITQKKLRKIRGKKISFIPQDPLSSLNPTFKIRSQMIDISRIHLGLRGKEGKDYAISLLQRVAIGNPRFTLRKYPHELSGGMRQRVIIAIAFSCEPSLIIADEPTTSLDVTTQVQILNILMKMKRETKTSVLYVTHNLGIVSTICDRVLVMYAGRIVENAPVNILFESPLHPYTKALLKAVPRHDIELDRLEDIEEAKPQIRKKMAPCCFESRCKEKVGPCQVRSPELKAVSEKHEVACLLFDNI